MAQNGAGRCHGEASEGEAIKGKGGGHYCNWIGCGVKKRAARFPELDFTISLSPNQALEGGNITHSRDFGSFIGGVIWRALFTLPPPPTGSWGQNFHQIEWGSGGGKF